MLAELIIILLKQIKWKSLPPIEVTFTCKPWLENEYTCKKRIQIRMYCFHIQATSAIYLEKNSIKSRGLWTHFTSGNHDLLSGTWGSHYMYCNGSCNPFGYGLCQCSLSPSTIIMIDVSWIWNGKQCTMYRCQQPITSVNVSSFEVASSLPKYWHYS